VNPEPNTVKPQPKVVPGSMELFGRRREISSSEQESDLIPCHLGLMLVCNQKINLKKQGILTEGDALYTFPSFFFAKTLVSVY
jgi:hypothetical protein